MKTVGGHPFSLALVNKAIRQNFRWSDIAEDCGVVGEFADGRERLADRILGRLQPFLAAELAIFDWAGQSTCDYRFLKFVIRTPGLTKIGGQGLLAADRPSIARLHDIVYACLKVQAWLTPERERALDDRLEEHLAKLVEEESLSLRIFATTMRAKLETLATKGRATPGILIALLEIWEPNEVNVGAVGNPEDHVVRLETKGGDISHTEIRFVLEAIEGLYRREKLQSYENAKVNYKARLPLFERLLAIKSLSPRSSSEVRHHWAKALKILGRIDEAREQFESVMSGPHPLDSTRLQLVRLYARDNQRAGVLADEILTAAGTPFSVTASVVLGVVENLSWAKGPWLEALFMKHSDLIEREILAAAEAGLNQAYSALASIGRHWAWHDPSRMIRIAVKLPMPSVDAADDRTRAALGEILAKAATSGGPDGRSLQEQALEFYSSIRNPVDFHLQKYGELLIEMGRFKDAEAVLGRIEKIETKAFAAYRMSQARLGQDDPEHAESLIDAAINALQPDQQKYRSTFLAHRFVVRRALHKYDALADLDEAIAACEPGKYQDHLKELRRSHRVQTASRSQKQT
jgi:tetratricopeptide (TPR) repeat protein